MSGARHAIRTRRWALGLLPALLLRALLPAGCMPAVGAGSLALVFCEPGVIAAAGAHGDHHHGGGTGGHGAAGECPFAQSAAPSLPTVTAPPSPPRLIALSAATAPTASAPLAAPLRHAAPRGPPARS